MRDVHPYRKYAAHGSTWPDIRLSVGFDASRVALDFIVIFEALRLAVGGHPGDTIRQFTAWTLDYLVKGLSNEFFPGKVQAMTGGLVDKTDLVLMIKIQHAHRYVV